MKRYTLVLGALFLGGCVKSPHMKQAIDVHECEARLSDVAIPLKRVPIRKLLSEYSYAYTTDELPSWLIDFYQREMERLGWNLTGKNEGNESTLIFNKPHKVSVVSIRPFNRKRSVYISIIQKRS